MTTDTKHTPGHMEPWRVVKTEGGRNYNIVNRDGGLIVQTDYENRAARIVACVNAHDGLVAERDQLRDSLRAALKMANTVTAERDAMRAEIYRLRGTLSGRIAADNASLRAEVEALRAALHAVITAHDMTQITAPSAGVLTARIDEARRALAGGGK